MSIKTYEAPGWDVIGDIHGCYHQFMVLLDELGYEVASGGGKIVHPDGRKIAIVGDCTDRGPENLVTFLTVKTLVDNGDCVYVLGNHDEFHLDWVQHGTFYYGNGTEDLVREYREAGSIVKEKIAEWLKSRPLKAKLTIPNYSRDVYISHAGCSFQRRDDEVVWGSDLYTNLLWDRSGGWIPSWREQDEAYMVYGHTPASEPKITQNTWRIDTACVFGEKLTAARFPEEEIVSVDGWKSS